MVSFKYARYVFFVFYPFLLPLKLIVTLQLAVSEGICILKGWGAQALTSVYRLGLETYVLW